mmetsp:Transcript_29882/g.62459  ORF Transcript_29882/g.62459 Transcript_29882/m.62459 type:complete len:220 (+) Transcript_29882:286-945(+)
MLYQSLCPNHFGFCPTNHGRFIFGFRCGVGFFIHRFWLCFWLRRCFLFLWFIVDLLRWRSCVDTSSRVAQLRLRVRCRCSSRSGGGTTTRRRLLGGSGFAQFGLGKGGCSGSCGGRRRSIIFGTTVGSTTTRGSNTFGPLLGQHGHLIGHGIARGTRLFRERFGTGIGWGWTTTTSSRSGRGNGFGLRRTTVGCVRLFQFAGGGGQIGTSKQGMSPWTG